MVPTHLAYQFCDDPRASSAGTDRQKESPVIDAERSCLSNFLCPNIFRRLNNTRSTALRHVSFHVIDNLSAVCRHFVNTRSTQSCDSIDALLTTCRLLSRSVPPEAFYRVIIWPECSLAESSVASAVRADFSAERSPSALPPSRHTCSNIRGGKAFRSETTRVRNCGQTASGCLKGRFFALGEHSPTRTTKTKTIATGHHWTTAGIGV